MTISPIHAAAAYARTRTLSEIARPQETPAAPRFADVLAATTKSAVASLETAEAATAAAVAGKADLTQVVTAVAEAEATLRTVAAVRDKVIAAYQEILRMPI